MKKSVSPLQLSIPDSHRHLSIPLLLGLKSYRVAHLSIKPPSAQPKSPRSPPGWYIILRTYLPKLCHLLDSETF
ncbi:hypothetical protein RSOLAG22IIIB_10599 [Rhizoctonia solani]|uniref:Uncharacterized protein n=1 Tax=Rhizoctonia solani TaxID=456999 RepID=A0A0K6G448_9AGAM|nr:hypothetical protein RSOLAG22IIIB_10599 [Rhizoctonia solani]